MIVEVGDTETGGIEVRGFVAATVDATGVEDVALADIGVVGEAADEQAVIRMAINKIRARGMKLLRENIFYSFLFLIPSISDIV